MSANVGPPRPFLEGQGAHRVGGCVIMVLCSCRYSGDRESFASDVRQIFTNCAYYNEDNSDVSD